MSMLPRPQRTVVWALAAALLAAGCGREDEPDAPAANAAEPAEPQEGELLLAAPPAGWTETGAMQTPVMRMAEYGPADEAQGTTERLTLESQAASPLPDPISFVLAVSRDLEQRCRGFQDINVSSGVENGYPTSVRLMFCPEFKDSPYGQVVMAKAIQGNEQFYVITRRRVGPPMQDTGQPLTAQAMAEWSAHLRDVSLCDTRDADHPCPAGIGPAKGQPVNAPATPPG